KDHETEHRTRDPHERDKPCREPTLPALHEAILGEQATIDAPGCAEEPIGALVIEVQHSPDRSENDLPTTLANPVTPFDFFPVEEDRAVEPARLLKHVAPHQHAGPDHPVGLALRIVIPVVTEERI